MCSMAALPNISSTTGTSALSWPTRAVSTCRAQGAARSSPPRDSDPGFIFSKPTAMTTSVIPPSISWRARNSAVDPLAQLLFRL
jgi:hypothetical protein